MVTAASKQYPKLLAFLQLFYPTLYEKLSLYSDRSDIVGANLVSSNNINSYRAIVFSEGMMKDGESFEIYAGNSALSVYSWDWRWVFAVKILLSGKNDFPGQISAKSDCIADRKTSSYRNLSLESYSENSKMCLRKYFNLSIDEKTSSTRKLFQISNFRKPLTVRCTRGLGYKLFIHS